MMADIRMNDEEEQEAVGVRQVIGWVTFRIEWVTLRDWNSIL